MQNCRSCISNGTYHLSVKVISIQKGQAARLVTFTSGLCPPSAAVGICPRSTASPLTPLLFTDILHNSHPSRSTPGRVYKDFPRFVLHSQRSHLGTTHMQLKYTLRKINILHNVFTRIDFSVPAPNYYKIRKL